VPEFTGLLTGQSALNKTKNVASVLYLRGSLLISINKQYLKGFSRQGKAFFDLLRIL